MDFVCKRNRSSGFTLIELLIVIAIIGILAAIAIPNLLNALQRGKQKRTMSDIRNLAIAIESYNVDNNQYPTATTCPTFPLTDMQLSSGSFTLLKPTYIAQPPFQDGWQKPLFYGVSTSGQAYTITSTGRDGKFGPDVMTPGGAGCGTTTDFNDDIVYSNGTFILYPDGPQH